MYTYHCAFDLSSDMILFTVTQHKLGETKIWNFCIQAIIQKDICGFNIPMNYWRVGEFMKIRKASGSTKSHSKSFNPVQPNSRLTCRCYACTNRFIKKTTSQYLSETHLSGIEILIVLQLLTKYIWKKKVLIECL